MAAWHPEIALADLRVRQGRYADAEELLLGKDQYVQALLPAARLALARGDVELAAAAARRGLRSLGDDRLRAVELLTVLVEAELARRRPRRRRPRLCRARTASPRSRCRRCRHGRHAHGPGCPKAAGGHDAAVALLERRTRRARRRASRTYRSVVLASDLARVRCDTGDRAGSALDAQGCRRPALHVPSTWRYSSRPTSICWHDLLEADRVGDARRRSTWHRPGSGVAASDGVERPTRQTPRGCVTADPPRGAGAASVHVLDLVDRVEGVERGIDRRQPRRRRPHTRQHCPTPNIAAGSRSCATTSRRAIKQGDDDTAARLDEELQQPRRRTDRRAFGLDGRGPTVHRRPDGPG